MLLSNMMIYDDFVLFQLIEHGDFWSELENWSKTQKETQMELLIIETLGPIHTVNYMASFVDFKIWWMKLDIQSFPTI